MWVDVGENDPAFPRLSEKLKCSNCGVYFDFAMEHFDALFTAMSNKLHPQEPARWEEVYLSDHYSYYDDSSQGG